MSPQPANPAELQPIHAAPRSFLRRAVFSTDHKVIARQFVSFGLFFLAVGGAMAMLIRWQLSYPSRPVPILGRLLFARDGGVISPVTYAALFTNHGIIMIFFAITPIVIGGFGNFCIPLMIGARDMAFPFLNLLSFWVQVLAGLLLLGSFFVPLGPAASGWTLYPPLSTNVGQPGAGQTLLLLALFAAGSSTIMGGINYITTVIRLRAPGMTYLRMPLTVWGLWLTAILNVLFVPIVASAVLLLLLDRMAGTQFFTAGLGVANGGDPLAFQHLFWIFGHPEVYILILPVWGIIGDLLSFFSRKPAYGYRRTVLAMCTITALSGVVWGHHMYLAGISPLLGEAFMTGTLIISIPSSVLFMNWLGTLFGGSIRFTTPMLFALGVVFVFGMGGLTGLLMGTLSTDYYLHDTYFVVGHFHLTMSAAVFMGGFAGLYFWFPKMFGRKMSEAWGRLHFWGTFIPLVLVFGGMLFLGYAGHPRRLYDPSQYDFLRHLLPLDRGISVVAFVLGSAQLIFVGNFFYSLVWGERAAENPWQVPTLEWTVASPPPVYNFDPIPLVKRGPHELGRPELTERDFLSQVEPDAGEPVAGSKPILSPAPT